MPVLGYIEPVPGIPANRLAPSRFWCSACRALGAILYSSFQSNDGPEFLARNLGWGRVQLQLEVPLDADGAAYLDHIDAWVNALIGANR